MGDSAPEFITGLLQAIVGIEIELTRLVGKSKLGQNREERDRLGAAAGGGGAGECRGGAGHARSGRDVRRTAAFGRSLQLSGVKPCASASNTTRIR